MDLSIIKTIGEEADKCSLDCFLVGGVVRDHLLGLESKDIDIMVVGDSVSFSRHIKMRLKGKNYVLFRKFRTARFDVESDDDTLVSVEVVGARKESYSASSRNPYTMVGSVKDDLSRRDFTINALAMKLNKDGCGDIIDFFNGTDDLDRKIIRTPKNPYETFSDDPLRMMRAARFSSQLQFTVDSRTLDGIKQAAGRIKIVSQERITQELLAILSSPIPSKGLSLLFDTGLLHHFFSEISELQGVSQIDGIGHKDVFWHTLKVVDNVSEKTNNLWLRMAALLHDVGKPKTKRFNRRRGWSFHGHDAVGAKMVPLIFKRMLFPSNHMSYVQKLVRLHLRPIPLSQEQVTDSAVRRLMVDAGDSLDDLMLLCRSDITSKNAQKVRRVLSNFEKVERKIKEIGYKDLWAKWRPPINGHDIMNIFGIKEGEVVGELKVAVEDAILDGIIPYDKGAAVEFLKQKMKHLEKTPL